MDITLSEEQQTFVREALSGKNVLVDACIGSGKTTAIQKLCTMYPTNKRILYLTYNKLLKADAREKIQLSNVTVQNYHGFAYKVLADYNIYVGPGELIGEFLKRKFPMPHLDVLIIDEYQDIDQEISEMLLYIKQVSPGLQIVAVGDTCQKIYDYTTLTNVSTYIRELLDGPEEIRFTKCFRLGHDLAASIGKVWGKEINGVNPDFKAEYMSFDNAVALLGETDPKDVLVLGAKKGVRVMLQNAVETKYHDKYNKYTLWSTTTADGVKTTTSPKKDNAIFTTFDGSKGMERPICFLCDYTEAYWGMRSIQPQQKYSILRNLFLVAASRGKNRLIFVSAPDESTPVLTEGILSAPFETCHDYTRPLNISDAFEHKYREDVDACFQLLKIEQVQEKGAEIKTKLSDANIDISPMVGEYVEASFFKNYSTSQRMEFINRFADDPRPLYKCDLQKQLAVITSVETGQWRYYKQVKRPFITEEVTKEIHKRLRTHFAGNEPEQIVGEIPFACAEGEPTSLRLAGMCDVLVNNIVYELKFVSSLQHTHFLQLACYLVMLNKTVGYLWNIRDDEMFRVTIPDVSAFLDQVARTVTKRDYTKYFLSTDSDAFWFRPPAINEEPHTAEEKRKLRAYKIETDAAAYPVGTHVKHQDQQGKPLFGLGIVESYNDDYSKVTVRFADGNRIFPTKGIFGKYLIPLTA